METFLDCVVCQQRQALRLARLVSDDEKLHEQIMRETMEFLAQRSWKSDPMTITKGLYDIVERLSGNHDPYKDLKFRSNEEMLQYYPQLQAYLAQNDDPLFTACKLAVAGNIMDFGAKDYFDAKATIQHVLETDFAINDYAQFQSALADASSVLFFADNAGEIVCDKLLLETMLAQYPLQQISVVVKAAPIINDATMDDVAQIGLDKLPRVEFRAINVRDSYNGTSAWMPPEVQDWIQSHDVIIAKGQANYEIMNEVPGIFFMLIAKCPIIERETGTHVGAYLLKYSS